MDNKTTSFIKTDDNTVINEQCIKWVKQIDECLYVCTKSGGCNQHITDRFRDTHKICKSEHPDSYHRVNTLFK